MRAQSWPPTRTEQGELCSHQGDEEVFVPVANRQSMVKLGDFQVRIVRCQVSVEKRASVHHDHSDAIPVLNSARASRIPNSASCHPRPPPRSARSTRTPLHRLRRRANLAPLPPSRNQRARCARPMARSRPHSPPRVRCALATSQKNFLCTPHAYSCF